jgi:hypothetical protein
VVLLFLLIVAVIEQLNNQNISTLDDDDDDDESLYTTYAIKNLCAAKQEILLHSMFSKKECRKCDGSISLPTAVTHPVHSISSKENRVGWMRSRGVQMTATVLLWTWLEVFDCFVHSRCLWFIFPCCMLWETILDREKSNTRTPYRHIQFFCWRTDRLPIDSLPVRVVDWVRRVGCQDRSCRRRRLVHTRPLCYTKNATYQHTKVP